ncbi:MAG: O-antigen ligase family protein [Gammaproteobacteria bacterium]
MTIINTWFIQEPHIDVGLHIYLSDLLFVGLFFLGVFRVFLVSGVLSVPLTWYLFGILIFTSLILGITQNGAAAGVDFREFFYLFAGTLYFLSFTYREPDIRHITNIWIAASAVLVGIVLLRWTAKLLGLGIAVELAGAVPFRVIDSGHTLVVAMGLVMLIHRTAYGSQGVSRWLTALLAVVIIGLQHRSVWIATVSAVLSLLLMHGSSRGRLLGNFAVMALIGAVSLLPLLLFGMLDPFLGSVADSAERATDLSTDTFGWRVEGWRALLSSWGDWDLLSKLIGEPFGSGWDSGRDVSPHNYYIETLLRTGLLGLTAFLAVFGRTLVRLYRGTARDMDSVYAPLLFAMMLSQLVYYVAYGIEPEHSVILGIAVSLACIGSVPRSSKRGVREPGRQEEGGKRASTGYDQALAQTVKRVPMPSVLVCHRRGGRGVT